MRALRVRLSARAPRFLLATRFRALTRVLGVVYQTISTHALRKARLTSASGATGAVTPIQGFGSALNLNIHFHMLVLDGACLIARILAHRRERGVEDAPVSPLGPRAPPGSAPGRLI